MGQKRKKNQPNSSSSTSLSESDGSDTEQITDSRPTNFPRFFLIESNEERKITSLSPFLIEKVLCGIVGEPKSVKSLYSSGQLLIEITKKAQADNIFKTTKFFDLKVKVTPHASLNSSKGVVRCPELKGVSDDEIRENLKEEGVIHVRRFKIKKNGNLISTNTFVFTFNSPKRPDKIKIGFLRCEVSAYVPNPLRCYHCQQYGHHELRCNRDPVFGNCAGPVAHDVDRCKNATKCANCGQGHRANSKECPVWNKEREILRIKYTNDISFVEARKMVDLQTVNSTQSYSSIAKSNSQSVKRINAETQTEPITILEPDGKTKTTTSLQSSSITQTSTTQTSEISAEESSAEVALAAKAKDTSAERPTKNSAPNPSRGKPHPPPRPRPTPKEKIQLNSDRQPKGSKDPIKLHNRFSPVQEMESEEYPRSSNTVRDRSPIKAP